MPLVVFATTAGMAHMWNRCLNQGSQEHPDSHSHSKDVASRERSVSWTNVTKDPREMGLSSALAAAKGGSYTYIQKGEKATQPRSSWRK